MSNTDDRSWVFKILLLGDAAVGKTSLIRKYVKDTFKEDYRATLGVNIISKEIRVNQINADVRLIIWDLAGQGLYEKTRKLYYEGCFGAFLVYDITELSSFENILEKWKKDYEEFSEEEISYVLVGNKSDLEDHRCVDLNKAKDLAEQINASDFIETSARLGNNVEKIFLKLVQVIFSKLGIFYDID